MVSTTAKSKQVEYNRRYRESPGNREKTKEYNKQYLAKLKKDPERYAKHIESKRKSAVARRIDNPVEEKARQKAASTRWRRSPSGFLKDAYRAQRSMSKLRNITPPNYSFEELKFWVESNDIYSALFSAWEESGYETYLKPSFDRVNPLLPYSLDNLQILTWRENSLKGIREKDLLYIYAVQHGSAEFKADFGRYLDAQ